MQKFVAYKGNNKPLISQMLQKRGNWVEADVKDLDDFRVQFIWRPVPLAFRTMQKLNTKVYHDIIINHFENNKIITTKHLLIRTLTAFYMTHNDAITAGYNVFDSTSTSFVITAGVDDLPNLQFNTRYRELSKGQSIRERLPLKHWTENMWLIKPVGENQGRGIEVQRNLKEIQASLHTKQRNSLWVLQKYIEKPLLFKGRKFDIRIWAMGTSQNEYYFYKRGYLRTSSDVYDTNAKDNYIHLTNNCLQQHGDKYGEHEDGNTLSLEAFQAYLDETFPDLKISYKDDIEPRIIDLMIDTFASARSQMNTGPRSNDFELFGFDFLIDEDFRVWLIECNVNPYLGVPNKYIEWLLPRMINDLFKLTIDKVHPPKNDVFPDEGNEFELILSNTVSKRRPYNISLYPRRELEQIPMYKIPKKPEIQDEILRQSPLQKPPKDILQQVKDIAEKYMIIDPDDFAKPLSRIMTKLRRWETMFEDNILNAWEALTIIAKTKGFRCTYVYLSQLFDWLNGNDVPNVIRLVSLETLSSLAKEVPIRKELVKENLIHKLSKYIIKDKYQNDFTKLSFEILSQISARSGKLYIPGETRQVQEIRLKFQVQGGFIAVWYASQTEEYTARANEVLDNFDTNDLEQQVCFWEQVLLDLDSEYKPTTPKSEGGKNVSKDQMDLSHDFPKCILDKKIMTGVMEAIKGIFAARKEQRNLQVQNLKIKQEKEKANELKIAEENAKKKAERQRRHRALKQKVIDNMKQKEKAEKKRLKRERQNELAMEIMRKRTVSDYIKRRDEQRRSELRSKQIQKEKEQERIEAYHSEMDERRKKVLEDWIRAKVEQEKAKKVADMKAAEEEENQRKQAYELGKIQRINERMKQEKRMQEFRKSLPKRDESLENPVWIVTADYEAEDLNTDIMSNVNARIKSFWMEKQQDAIATRSASPTPTHRRRLNQKSSRENLSIVRKKKNQKADVTLIQIYGTSKQRARGKSVKLEAVKLEESSNYGLPKIESDKI